MLESIYGSKFYKTSKYTDKINAAIADPSNVGLVKQLASYLDNDYQKAEYVNPSKLEDDQAKLDNETGSIDDGDLDMDGLEVDDNFSQDDLVQYPSSDAMLGDVNATEPDSIDGVDLNNHNDLVEESTFINASTDLDIEVLKGTLNSREDTQGVARVQQKENELWLYYSDDVNLNNIMTNVIEYSTSYYSNLTFNRLARSENAIVFEINNR